jgi:hypothetical protein
MPYFFSSQDFPLGISGISFSFLQKGLSLILPQKSTQFFGFFQNPYPSTNARHALMLPSSREKGVPRLSLAMILGFENFLTHTLDHQPYIRLRVLSLMKIILIETIIPLSKELSIVFVWCPRHAIGLRSNNTLYCCVH